jgi:hypothetical protein
MVSATESVALFRDALRFAVVLLFTAVVLTVKFAVETLAETVTLAGGIAAELSLDVVTTVPPDAPKPTR